MSLKPPKLRGPLVPRTIDGETMWVSADGAWVLVARAPLERRVGRPLGDGPDALDDELDLGLGMAATVDDGATADDAFADEDDLFAVDAEDEVAEPGPVTWDSPEVDVEAEAVPDVDVTPLPAAPPSSLRSQLSAVPHAPASNREEEATRRLWMLSMLTFAGAAVLVMAAILLVVVGRSTPPPPAPAAPEVVLAPVPAVLDQGIPAPADVVMALDTARDSDAEDDAALVAVTSEDDGPSTPEDAVVVTQAAAEGLPIEEAPSGHPVVPATIPRGPDAPAPAWLTHLRTGWELIDMDAVEAEQHFRAAIVLYPRNGDAYRGLGEALLRQGKRTLANDNLCEARRLDRALRARVDALMASESMSCDGHR